MERERGKIKGKYAQTWAVMILLFFSSNFKSRSFNGPQYCFGSESGLSETTRDRELAWNPKCQIFGKN